VSVARETHAHPASGVARETHPEPSAKPGIPARIALLPIRFYRRFISPALGQRCRYYPTCSSYAEEAVRELGAFRGMILAAWRVLRCNPFSPGGLDPVSERTIFRGSTPRTKRANRESF
jgi:putative membrane protein insertion efficiency factor